MLSSSAPGRCAAVASSHRSRLVMRGLTSSPSENCSATALDESVNTSTTTSRRLFLFTEAGTTPSGEVPLEIRDARESFAPQCPPGHQGARTMATVDHELGVSRYREPVDATRYSPERDMPCAGNMSARKFDARAHVEDHWRGAGLDAIEERLGRDAIRRHVSGGCERLCG